MIKTILKYEGILFLRNQFQLIMLGMFLVFSFYAIYYGQALMSEHRKTIDKITHLQEEEFHQYQASFQEEPVSLEARRKRDIATDPAFAWHRHGYHSILPPLRVSGLAIGQRDLYPFYYRLTGMSLHYQLFQNEIANPLKLSVGNFDLSFVIVYLLPLIIIAFTYNLYSAEKEWGILPLLKIQSAPLRIILLIRLSFYFILLIGLTLGLSALGLWIVGVFLESEAYLSALMWLLTVICYGIFWFSLMFFLISFRKNSAFNALSAIGVWLLFLVLIPAILNILASTKYPISSTSLVELARRTSLENEEDEEAVLAVIHEFFEYQPEYTSNDSLLRNNLFPKAYAAFTSLKDIRGKKIVDQYHQSVRQRNEWVFHYHFINPATQVQSLFNRIAETDLHTFLEFQQAIADFHKQITHFYFEKLFKNLPITKQDYEKLPRFEWKPSSLKLSSLLAGLVPMLFASSLFCIVAIFMIKKH